VDELVVQLDGFERLDEERLAGGAGAVDHAADFASGSGADGDDKAVVAERDVVFAGLFAAVAEELAQRFLDGVAGAGDLRADAAELGGSVVAQVTVGENRAADRGGKRTEVGERRGAGGEEGKFGRMLFEGETERGGGVKERGGVEKVGRRENGGGGVEPGEPGVRVGERAKTQFAPGAEPGDGFADVREGGVERGAVVGGRERFNSATAGRTGGLAADEVEQAAEFEKVESGAGRGDSLKSKRRKVEEGGELKGRRVERSKSESRTG